MIPQVDVKLELDDPPAREEIKKATIQLKAGHLALMAFQQKSNSAGKQSSISSRICLPTVGRKELYRRTSGMQSLSLYKQTKNRI